MEQWTAVHPIDSFFFQDIFGTEEMRAVFADRSLFQKWLDVEAALARVEGQCGIIPAGAADEISHKARVERIDAGYLRRAIQSTGQVILGVVKALAEACDGDAGEYVHWGATTQDIMDTAVVLQLKEACEILQRDLTAIKESLTRLAAEHNHTVMAGRTYGQHALPITFGFKCAVWLDEVARHLDRLDECRARLLVGQFAGATGTMASLGEQGLFVQTQVLEELGLAPPRIAWFAARDRFAEFASLLAMISTTLAKIANEIISLQKTEINELAEPFPSGKVGSSTMPHKRNPMLCEGIVTLSRLIRANTAAAYEGMIHEHERDTWWAEWVFIPEICLYMASVLDKMRYVLANLVVNPVQMERNVNVSGGLIVSEAIMFELGRRIGRQTAHELVYEVARASFEKDLPFREMLVRHPKVSECLSPAELDALLDPKRYVGLSSEFAVRIVQAIRVSGMAHDQVKE